MAMRHLITGQNNCAPDGASSSNPFGALANSVLGQSSKAQSIKELPGAAVSIPTTSDLSTTAPLSTIPGLNEFKQDQRPLARGTDFIRGGPANDWVESFRPPPPGIPQFGGPEVHFEEFEQIYNNAGSTFRPPLDGPPQRVLSGVLHSFLASGRAGVPFQPVPVPALGLSEGDKQCIRDRSCIMARHILADQPEEYIQAQVNTLLHSLDIGNDYRMRGPMHGPYPELEEYWNQSQSALRSAPMHNAADKWITEFGKQHNNPEDWAHSFDQHNNSVRHALTDVLHYQRRELRSLYSRLTTGEDVTREDVTIYVGRCLDSSTRALELSGSGLPTVPQGVPLSGARGAPGTSSHGPAPQAARGHASVAGQAFGPQAHFFAHASGHAPDDYDDEGDAPDPEDYRDYLSTDVFGGGASSSQPYGAPPPTQPSQQYGAPAPTQATQQYGAPAPTQATQPGYATPPARPQRPHRAPRQLTYSRDQVRRRRPPQKRRRGAAD